MSRILVSATRKSSGKTMLAAGLCRALARRGLGVQSFKKGPDYIDPMWLGMAGRRPCINLDFNTMCENEILEAFGRYQADAAISIIEGNKGLFDGVDPLGSDSNAAMAKLLQAPVIIVIDAAGITRGVAPLLNGYQGFDPDIQIAGIVLNNLGGRRHETKLRDVISHYTDIEVLGGIQRHPNLLIPERHLGLTTHKEAPVPERIIDNLAAAVDAEVDIDRIIEIAEAAAALPDLVNKTSLKAACGIRIGIAHDDAFCFYYEDDFQTMRQQGVHTVFFDTLRDRSLPEVDALFIGGGFPEVHGVELEQNIAMRDQIRRFADSGRPIYAECGGLMYLSRQITWQGRCNQMVGVIPADTRMQARPVGRGYVVLESTSHHPWDMTLGGARSTPCPPLHAHEFHHSSLHNLGDQIEFAYRVKRGHGINGRYDGLVYKNIFASYSHMRNTQSNPWIKRFIAAIQKPI